MEVVIASVLYHADKLAHTRKGAGNSRTNGWVIEDPDCNLMELFAVYKMGPICNYQLLCHSFAAGWEESSVADVK